MELERLVQNNTFVIRICSFAGLMDYEELDLGRALVDAGQKGNGHSRPGMNGLIQVIQWLAVHEDNETVALKKGQDLIRQVNVMTILAFLAVLRPGILLLKDRVLE
jgi:hypothetical protein